MRNALWFDELISRSGFDLIVQVRPCAVTRRRTQSAVRPDTMSTLKNPGRKGRFRSHSSGSRKNRQDFPRNGRHGLRPALLDDEKLSAAGCLGMLSGAGPEKLSYTDGRPCDEEAMGDC